jgi:hypothetical protein
MHYIPYTLTCMIQQKCVCVCVCVCVLLYCVTLLKSVMLFHIWNIVNSNQSCSLKVELTGYYIKTGVPCRSGGESLQIEAGSLQRRDYWLTRLRHERRNFGARCLYLIQHPELWACFSLRGNLVGALNVPSREKQSVHILWGERNQNNSSWVRHSNLGHFNSLCLVLKR